MNDQEKAKADRETLLTVRDDYREKLQEASRQLSEAKAEMDKLTAAYQGVCGQAAAYMSQAESLIKERDELKAKLAEEKSHHQQTVNEREWFRDQDIKWRDNAVQLQSHAKSLEIERDLLLKRVELGEKASANLRAELEKCRAILRSFLAYYNSDFFKVSAKDGYVLTDWVVAAKRASDDISSPPHKSEEKSVCGLCEDGGHQG